MDIIYFLLKFFKLGRSFSLYLQFISQTSLTAIRTCMLLIPTMNKCESFIMSNVITIIISILQFEMARYNLKLPEEFKNAFSYPYVAFLGVFYPFPTILRKESFPSAPPKRLPDNYFNFPGINLDEYFRSQASHF